MEDYGIDGNIFLVNRPPFMKTDFSCWMKHSNFATDPTRYEYISCSLAHINRRPGKRIKIFPRKKKR